MTLQERLRQRCGFFRNGATWCMATTEDTDCTEAADALDAKDARIKELVELMEEILLDYRRPTYNEWRRKAHAVVESAREALK